MCVQLVLQTEPFATLFTLVRLLSSETLPERPQRSLIPSSSTAKLTPESHLARTRCNAEERVTLYHFIQAYWFHVYLEYSLIRFHDDRSSETHTHFILVLTATSQIGSDTSYNRVTEIMTYDLHHYDQIAPGQRYNGDF